MKSPETKLVQNSLENFSGETDEFGVRIESFCKRHFESDKKGAKRITLEDLNELKEAGITTEFFLDYLCKQQGFLLHGSIHDISGNKLKSDKHKIFASDKSAVAIMKSIYSNIGVNLHYPYFISESQPLVLKIDAPDKKLINTDKGFVYIVDEAGFENEPVGSWQYIKEADEVEFAAVVETEVGDFKYPVEFVADSKQ